LLTITGLGNTWLKVQAFAKLCLPRVA